MGYATQSDIEAHAPPEQLVRPARLVSTVSTSTDILTLDGHGLQTDDPVTLRADASGSLPSPLAAGTTYYAIRVTDATFQLSASAGGSALNLTTAGSNVLLVRQIPWTRADTFATSIVDMALQAHALVPLAAPYPQIVVEVAATLAGEWLRRWAGVSSRQMTEVITWAQQQLDRFASVPVRGTNAPTGANITIRASATAVDARGWERVRGSIP